MARPKGSINKVSASAKDNIAAVFNRLGGSAQMAEWAQANMTEFYRIYARLVPVEQRIADPNGDPVQIAVSFIAKHPG